MAAFPQRDQASLGQHLSGPGLELRVLQRTQSLPDQGHRDATVGRVFQQVEHPHGLGPVGVGDIAAAERQHQ